MMSYNWQGVFIINIFQIFCSLTLQEDPQEFRKPYANRDLSALKYGRGSDHYLVYKLSRSTGAPHRLQHDSDHWHPPIWHKVILKYRGQTSMNNMKTIQCLPILPNYSIEFYNSVWTYCTSPSYTRHCMLLHSPIVLIQDLTKDCLGFMLMNTRA